MSTYSSPPSLDHDDGSFMYRDEGNVVAFAGSKNYEGLVCMRMLHMHNMQSHVLSLLLPSFNKSDVGNLFVRPDFEGPGEDSKRAVLRNALGQRVTAVGVPLPEAFYFPACYRSLGQWTWGRELADISSNNTCILNATSSPYIFGGCNPAAPGADGRVPETSNNSFLTPGGALGISCGGRTLSLEEAQAVGYEVGSTAAATPDLDAVVSMIHQWLQY